jgi:hypothetical protein
MSATVALLTFLRKAPARTAVGSRSPLPLNALAPQVRRVVGVGSAGGLSGQRCLAHRTSSTRLTGPSPLRPVLVARFPAPSRRAASTEAPPTKGQQSTEDERAGGRRAGTSQAAAFRSYAPGDSSSSDAATPNAAAEKKETANWASAKRAARFATVAKREIVLGLMFLPVALSSTLALPFFVGNILDNVVGPLATVGNLPVAAYGGLTQLQATVAALLGISVVGAGASVGRSYFINLALEKIGQHLRRDLFGSYLDKEVEFFDRNKTGDLMNRLSADTAIIGTAVTESVSIAIRGVATLTLGTGFLFYTSWELALVSTATLLPIMLLSRVYGSFIKQRTKRQLEVLGQGSAAAEEAVSNIRNTFIFNRQDFALGKYARQIDAAFEVGREIAYRRGLFMGATNLVLSLSILSAVGYGSMMVANGTLSPGQLTSFLLYSINVGGASFQLTVRSSPPGWSSMSLSSSSWSLSWPSSLSSSSLLLLWGASIDVSLVLRLQSSTECNGALEPF